MESAPSSQRKRQKFRRFVRNTLLKASLAALVGILQAHPGLAVADTAPGNQITVRVGDLYLSVPSRGDDLQCASSKGPLIKQDVRLPVSIEGRPADVSIRALEGSEPRSYARFRDLTARHPPSAAHPSVNDGEADFYSFRSGGDKYPTIVSCNNRLLVSHLGKSIGHFCIVSQQLLPRTELYYTFNGAPLQPSEWLRRRKIIMTALSAHQIRPTSAPCGQH